MNEVVFTPTFKKLYKIKQRSQKFILEGVDSAITNLKNSENPKSLGERKKGNLQEFLSYKIGSKYRILYDVKDDGRIYLYKVCSHKRVYGKD